MNSDSPFHYDLDAKMSAKLLYLSQRGIGDRSLLVWRAIIQRGASVKAIARELHLAQPTVKYHVRKGLKALEVTNQREALIALDGAAGSLPICRGMAHSNTEPTQLPA